jgi:DNA topoisomerase-2
VWNNGDGIPVEMHKEEGVYVPELIFGHLLTSSNYNDTEKKVRLAAAQGLLHV